MDHNNLFPPLLILRFTTISQLIIGGWILLIGPVPGNPAIIQEQVTRLYPTHYVKDHRDPYIIHSPTLSLHTRPDFEGDELFFNGVALSLPQPTLFSSHRFTGRINWTLYPNVNFTGQPTCLVADQTFPVTYNDEFEVMVGSVRQACWCNYSVTVTPKPSLRSGSKGETQGAVRLWAGSHAQGNSIYTDGIETRLPTPIQIKSFQLLGRWKQWTIFENQDLSGLAVCLVPDESGSGSREGGDEEDKAGPLYTNIAHRFTVGSIREGCVALTDSRGISPPPQVIYGALPPGEGVNEKKSNRPSSTSPSRDSHGHVLLLTSIVFIIVVLF